MNSFLTAAAVAQHKSLNNLSPWEGKKQSQKLFISYKIGIGCILWVTMMKMNKNKKKENEDEEIEGK